MTTFRKVAFAAAATAVSLLAAASPSFACSGNLTEADVRGIRNTVDLELSGRGLYASFMQAGYGNEAVARITGACNAAIILQRGDLNYLYARVTNTNLGAAQFGDDNSLEVDSDDGDIGVVQWGDSTVNIHNRGPNTIMVATY